MSDTDPNKKAAEALLTELTTRIVIQPLPYQHGIESKALISLYSVFGTTRKIILDNPGCEAFARLATDMLNLTLRPVTAKWDRLNEQGALESRDGGDAFRIDLADVQKKLLETAEELHVMAYGKPGTINLVEHPLTEKQLDTLIDTSIPYGIPDKDQVDECIKDRVAPAGLLEKEKSDFGTSKINEDENRDIEKRRKKLRKAKRTDVPEDGENAIGLAFSGGGIRSATFCLGVTQVLADKKLLPDVDFLSSVSGGGYTASFITRHLGDGGDVADLAGPTGPDPKPIRYLRQRAKFLMASDLWDTVGMVTSTVMGMLLHWLAPISILALLALLGGVAFFKINDDCWATLSCGAGGIVLLSGLTYFGTLRYARAKVSSVAGWIFAIFTVVAVTVLVAWLADFLYRTLLTNSCCDGTWPDLPTLWKSFTGSCIWTKVGLSGGLSVGAISALVPIVLRYLPVIRKPKHRLALNKIALTLAGLILPVLGFALFLFLCGVSRVDDVNLFGARLCGGGFGLLLWFVGISIVIAYTILNINHTGPHRLYRRGLCKTFIGKKDNEAPIVELSKINTGDSAHAPYHLLNATANLPQGKSQGLRERKADFFLFSKYWMGSPVLGYRPTKEWKMNGQDADLATAMATSGAAFSSNMGLASIPPLRALLTALNVRLGFWIRRPQRNGLPIVGRHPSFGCLLREMTGFGMNENKAWVNVSDGGHIENLATYELLRRRCKFIVCVDGEADPKFTFHGLMTLIRHAQLDHGVRIDPKLDDIRPNSESGYSRTHYHLCRIHYPEKGPNGEKLTGLLLYIKLSVTGNESELIRRYRKTHPAFPHQTTLDQFFDEEQFEAYRQLGVHVAEGLFSRCLMRMPEELIKPSEKEAEKQRTKVEEFNPASTKDWFRRLAANLLLPELEERPLKR